MTTAILQGFLFSLSLILAIGAQNAFVMRQGIRNQHLFLVCSLCALSDGLLIQFGVLGMHRLITALPSFATLMRYGGALFLLCYALLRFKACYHGGEALQNAQKPDANSWRKTALITLAITWLNPHVYLDTILLLGSIAAQYHPYQEYFALGATLASFCFFFSLGYGACLLRPWLSQPRIWRIIELLIGLFMLYLALKLLFSP